MHAPPEAVRAIALCHPHPLYGGSMHSPVPLAMARTLSDVARDRVAWVRFNFRGVGASEGSYDEGRGERDDALSVLAHLRAMLPSAKMSVLGHSFGSWVAWQAAVADPLVERVLLIAPSSRFFSFESVVPSRSIRTTIFIGDHDELCDVEDARSLGAKLAAEVRVFEGFDHHFLKSRRALAEAALPVIAPEIEWP